MMKYRTKTLVTETGLTLSELIIRRARLGLSTMYPENTGRVEEKEVILEPRVFISVWNCRISLAASFELPGGQEVGVTYPHPLPRRVEEAAERDLWKQGGAINISGRYEILSSTVRRFVESEKFQNWLMEEAKRLGLDIVME